MEWGGLRPPSLNSGYQVVPKGPPFGITLRHPFLTDHPQKFYKGVFGTNVINF